jgi:hypothetical protein
MIETQRLTMRVWRCKDFAPIQRNGSDREVRATLGPRRARTFSLRLHVPLQRAAWGNA